MVKLFSVRPKNLQGLSIKCPCSNLLHSCLGCENDSGIRSQEGDQGWHKSQELHQSIGNPSVPPPSATARHPAEQDPKGLAKVAVRTR